MKFFKSITTEIRTSLKSKFFIGTLIVVPVIFGLLIGFAFSWKRAPQRIPVAVWDRDNQALSRAFLRNIDATQAFDISNQVADMEAGKALFISGKVRGFLIIPPDFSKNLNTGKQSRIVFYQDFNYLLPGRTLAKTITKLESWEQEKWFKRFFEEKGLSGASAEFLKNPVRVEYKRMFNPSLEYTQFLLPGLLTVVLFQVLFLIGGAAVFTNNSAYKGQSTIMFLSVKTCSAMILSIIPFAIIYGLMFPLFNILIGNIVLIFLYYVGFAFASLFMGMLISTIFKEPVFSTEIIIGLGAVAFSFSGFTWPLYMFPAIFKIAASLFPLTPFLEESSKIWYKTGYPLNPLPLIALIVIYFIPLFLLTRKRRMIDAKTT